MASRHKCMESLIGDIEYEIFQRSGEYRSGELAFTCPSHNDTNPSARWHREKWVWYCDACGDGGGAIDLGIKLGVKRS
jgi:hypothetical protein